MAHAPTHSSIRSWRLALWLGALLLLIATPIDASATAAPDLRKDMKRAIRSGDETLAQATMSKLAEEGSPESIEAITWAMREFVSRSLFDHGVEVLTDVGSEKLGAFFEPLFEERKPDAETLGIAMVLAETLKDDRSESWITTGLRHELDLVVRLAMHAAVERRSKAAIPVLIDLIDPDLTEGRGAITHFARASLVALVGQDFQSIEDWRNFWKASGATFDPEASDEDEPTKVHRDVEAPEFFGVPIISSNVAFVIDISGSMQRFDPGGESGRSSWEVRQRITRTKRALAEAINKLSKDSKFNVIAFNEEITRFQKRLVPASKGAKNKSMRWVKKLVADRGTDTGAALKAAFEDPRVDTIVLLSDGSPHTPEGEPRELMPKVLRLIKDLNRIRRVPIHTFGFTGEGEWPPGSKYRGQPIRANPQQLEAFLREIAKSTGGEFTKID